jgi:hypothetical protein
MTGLLGLLITLILSVYTPAPIAHTAPGLTAYPPERTACIADVCCTRSVVTTVCWRIR